MSRKQKKVLIRIIITSVCIVPLFFIPLKGIPLFVIYLILYLIIGYDILLKAAKGIVNGRVFDENFLMAVATIGAFALAIYEKSNDYLEAIAVMLFYQIGELFQSFAVRKSRKNISALMDIRPDYANIEKDGEIIRVNPSEVEKGSIITVMPGEKIPIDGIVVEGDSSLNTSALTGESLPKDVCINDEVLSGCINLSGVLKIKTTKEFGESTVSKILELVENSGSRKSRSENFISKFAKIYTPAVVLGAVCLAVLPPLFNLLILRTSPGWNVWIYRSLTFLVISCPCALVISIPLSFFAGIGCAGHEGILIKGSNYLETLSSVKYVVFDKTGTLTEGVFDVRDIHHNILDKDTLIEFAALTESASSHPISQSLKKAYDRNLSIERVSDIKEIAGQGITAVIDDKKIAVGNDKLMENSGIEYKPCHMSGTIVHVAIDGRYEGHIVISDVIKKDSEKAISELKNTGIKKTVMLTGDSKKVAENVAAELGVDEYHAELLPADKVTKLEEIMDTKPSGQKLAFVGDGINDAPVLARADIGIAMGAIGSDAAIEAADVVLMDDNPMQIAKAIKISRKCIRIVYENIIFALVIKFACLGLGALGIANMWFAIFADVGVMVIAVLNAIRALRISGSA